MTDGNHATAAVREMPGYNTAHHVHLQNRTSSGKAGGNIHGSTSALGRGDREYILI